MTDALLPKLGEAAERLNKSFDAISDRVKGIELHLAHVCKLGITETVYSEDGNFGLSYARCGREWRLVAGYANKIDDDGVPHDSKAWTDCSRDLKLATVPLIPRLLLTLTEKTESLAKAAEAVLASIPEVDSDDEIPF